MSFETGKARADAVSTWVCAAQHHYTVNLPSGRIILVRRREDAEEICAAFYAARQEQRRRERADDALQCEPGPPRAVDELLDAAAYYAGQAATAIANHLPLGDPAATSVICRMADLKLLLHDLRRETRPFAGVKRLLRRARRWIRR